MGWPPHRTGPVITHLCEDSYSLQPKQLSSPALLEVLTAPAVVYSSLLVSLHCTLFISDPIASVSSVTIFECVVFLLLEPHTTQ